MASPIAEMALGKGVRNVDFSQLAPERRAEILDEIGETQLRRGNHEEAAWAFALARSPKLRELTGYFLNSGLPAIAAAYAQHLDDRHLLEEVAFTSLHHGAKAEAKRLFRRTGNEAMVRFIDENL